MPRLFGIRMTLRRIVRATTFYLARTLTIEWTCPLMFGGMLLVRLVLDDTEKHRFNEYNDTTESFTCGVLGGRCVGLPQTLALQNHQLCTFWRIHRLNLNHLDLFQALGVKPTRLCVTRNLRQQQSNGVSGNVNR